MYVQQFVVVKNLIRSFTAIGTYRRKKHCPAFIYDLKYMYICVHELVQESLAYAP